MSISNEQLARLLAGMAAANVALLSAVVNRQTVLQSGTTVLRGMSGLNANTPVSFDNIYARMLLGAAAGVQADSQIATFAEELKRLTQ